MRNLLVEAINHGMDEGFQELAVQEDEFQGNHQDGEPMPGTGDVVQVPMSRRSSETAGVGRHVEFGRTGPRLEGSSARTVGQRRKTQGDAALQGSEGEGEEEQEHERDRFSPRHGRAGRRGMAIPAAATGASTTTSTAPPTQPGLPHPPPHRASLDSSSRSSNHSSNLNSSPSSSISRRRPRGVQQPNEVNFSRTAGGGRGGGSGRGGANEGRGGAGKGGF